MFDFGSGPCGRCVCVCVGDFALCFKQQRQQLVCVEGRLSVSVLACVRNPLSADVFMTLHDPALILN